MKEITVDSLNVAELVSEHDGVLRHTLSDGHPVHRHLRDAVEVDERRRDHEHVEYLVTLELNGHSHLQWNRHVQNCLEGGGEDHPEFGGYGMGKGSPGTFLKYRYKIVRLF